MAIVLSKQMRFLMSAIMSCRRGNDKISFFLFYLFSKDLPPDVIKHIKPNEFYKEKDFDFQEKEFLQFLELSDEELIAKFKTPRRKVRPPLTKTTKTIDDIIADLF